VDKNADHEPETPGRSGGEAENGEAGITHVKTPYPTKPASAKIRLTGNKFRPLIISAPHAPTRHEGKSARSPRGPSLDGVRKQTTRTNHMNSLEMKGDWNIAKGKLKQKWAKLTDDDLQYVDGKQDEMLGRIQKRTGESREAIEKAIKESYQK
jgi:uncharacterized protein YjbJ (UPF0337 family)